jgi:hypothetical protein
MLTNLHFYWVAASADTSRSPIDTSRSLIASVRSPSLAGVALDVIGWRVVQIFHHIKFEGFLHLLLDCGESNTSRTPITPRATPTDVGNQIEQQIQDSGWRRAPNTDSHWSESQEYN